MPARTANKDISGLNQGGAQVEELLSGAQGADDSARRSARIVAIPLSQILPDRYQSRVILPPEIKEAFYGGEIDCYDAARLMLNAAQGDDGLRKQVEELLLLGTSILADTQIEPATGSWVKTGSGSRFLLEAGERRFWSLVLKAVEQEMPEEPRLKTVEQKEVGRVRQISENLQREDLCAVDLGKAIASLILALQDIHPAAGQGELDYFRQALSVRVPRGTWPEIQRVVKMDRTYLFRHLQILSLDDQLLYLASIYRLEEARLRAIVAAPAEMHRKLMLMAVREKLTQADLARASEEGREGKSEERSVSSPGPHRKLASRVKSIVRFISRSDFDQNFDEVASELSALLRNPQEDLGHAASYLESLAASLRKVQKRFG
jgi:hypothetical protein